MADFDPFNVPGGETPQQQNAPQQNAPQQAHAKHARKAPAFLDKLPKNGFGRFVRRFWGALAAVLAVALVFVIFGNAILVKVAPAWAVGRSTTKTTKAIMDRIDGSPYKAVEIFGKSLLSGSIGCGFSISDDYDSADGNLTLVTALKDKSFSLSGAINFNGASGDAELFVNDKRAALRSSGLDDCYGVTYETFEDDLRASALPEYLGLTEADIRAAGDVMDQVVNIMQFDPAALIESYSKLYADFLKDMDFDSDSEKTDVGGERTSCTVISAELDERDLRDFILDCYDLGTEDQGLQDAIVGTMIADGYYTPAEAKQIMEAQIRDARQELENELRMLKCDLELAYYLYSNQLVKSVVTGDIAVSGESMEMELTMDFGRNPEKDDWLLSCEFTSGYGDRMYMEAEYSSEVERGQYRDTLYISMDQGWGLQTAAISSDWNRENGDLAMTVESNGNVETLYCNLMVNGDSCELTLDNTGLEALGGSTEFNITLTADKAAKLENPEYVNLDQWDMGVIEKFQAFADSLSSGSQGQSTSASASDWG